MTDEEIVSALKSNGPRLRPAVGTNVRMVIKIGPDESLTRWYSGIVVATHAGGFFTASSFSGTAITYHTTSWNWYVG